MDNEWASVSGRRLIGLRSLKRDLCDFSGALPGVVDRVDKAVKENILFAKSSDSRDTLTPDALAIKAVRGDSERPAFLRILRTLRKALTRLSGAAAEVG